MLVSCRDWRVRPGEHCCAKLAAILSFLALALAVPKASGRQPPGSSALPPGAFTNAAALGGGEAGSKPGRKTAPTDGGVAGLAATNSPAPAPGDPSSPPGQSFTRGSTTAREQWNWHLQNTDTVQGDPGFPAPYSGPGSLSSRDQIKETVSLDLLAGVRLWPGAEAHVDGLMWQGFGLSDTRGIEAFPNGEAFKVGVAVPNLNLARVFIRQTIGLGGEQEAVPDDPLTLAGKRDGSRLTFTLGRFSAKDVFDNNAYANDPRTQFMNWALMANEAWDYPADPLGFISGLAAQLNLPQFALRYGVFQVPEVSNGQGLDPHYLEAWAMVTEFERRYAINSHPGALRLLAYLNRAHMGSYQEAVQNYEQGGSSDITQTRAYRFKYGFGLNWEQEVAKGIGLFSRLGWSEGRQEAWVFSDVDYTASSGLSIKGVAWQRPDDTFGFAGVLSGISHVHQVFFEDGGTGILGGDGALAYGWEKTLETYYDFKIWKTIHAALDYQFVVDPAFNRDRGPVSIFGARLHWEF
jgi:high affinity Mn2+ porin